ncbi:hypothetical protein VM98_33825, partial [Streptomyces rubellomurinus subsp. indigoferus]
DAAYWYTNLREPVRFAPVIEHLARHGTGVFVEASPHPVVPVGIGETVDQAGGTAAAIDSLRRDEGGQAPFRHAVAEPWTHGPPVDCGGALGGRRPVHLPRSPFQGRRCLLPACAGQPAPPAPARPPLRQPPE